MSWVDHTNARDGHTRSGNLVIVDAYFAKHDPSELATERRRLGRPTARANLFALVLQGEERRCINAVLAQMRADEVTIGAIVHDGLMIRHREDLDLEACMAHAEEAVTRATGYVMALLEKPMFAPYDSPPDWMSRNPDHVPNAMRAGGGSWISTSLTKRARL